MIKGHLLDEVAIIPFDTESESAPVADDDGLSELGLNSEVTREGDIIRGQVLLPALEQLSTEGLSKSADVGDVSSREQHVSYQVVKLFLETFNGLAPSD